MSAQGWLLVGAGFALVFSSGFLAGALWCALCRGREEFGSRPAADRRAWHEAGSDASGQ